MSWRVRFTAARMSSSSLPALPTNGSPVASSFSPGPSPTSMSGEYGSPVPKTVLVRLRARSHFVQTATCRASSARRSSLFSPPSAASKRLSTTPPQAIRQRFASCYSTPVSPAPARERQLTRLSIIEFHGGNKWFGDFQVLKDIEFSGVLVLDGMRLDDKKTNMNKVRLRLASRL